MNNFLKYTLSLLIIIISGFCSPQLTSAEELTGSGIVDSFEISETNLAQGQTTSVKVTFSEKYKNQFKPGDTLTFPLPPGLEGMTENDGSPRKILLSDLGEALIYKDKVVATVNDHVKFLDHVRGSFSFGIRSSITNSKTDTTIETNFGTTLPLTSITVSGISDNQGTGKLPFFYKSGDLLGDSDKVRWFLNTNLNKEELGDDIIISDTSGPGQKLNKESFNFTVDNYLGINNYSLSEFISKGFGTLEFTSDNKFIIRFKREHARLASITTSYTTTITSEGRKQDVFENSYDLNYRIFNQQPLNESNSVSVKNIFAEGEANGDLDKNDPIEHEIDQPIENVDPLPENTPESETPKIEETDNPTNEANESQPEIHIDEKEEILDDESDKVKDLEDAPKEETINPKDVENELNNTTEKFQPEIHTGEKEETIKPKDWENKPTNSSNNKKVETKNTSAVLATSSPTSNKDKNSLPKTGIKNNIILTILGFVFLILSSILMFRKYKKNKIQ